jgi:mono/diheme cytochrome c family protein
MNWMILVWLSSAALFAADDPPPDMPPGARVMAEANPRCSLCHSVAGKGNPKGPLDGVGQRRSRDEIKAWIRTPVEMAKKHGATRKPAMVPFPEFSDEELETLVDYLASLPPPAPPK